MACISDSVFFTLEFELPAYILPVLPPATLLIADRIGTGWANTSRITGILSLCLGAAAYVYATRSGLLSPTEAVMCTAPFILAGLFAMLWSRFRTASVVSI